MEGDFFLSLSLIVPAWLIIEGSLVLGLACLYWCPGDYSATYTGDWFSLTTKRPVYGQADSHALVHHWVHRPTWRCLTCCRTGQEKGEKNTRVGWRGLMAVHHWEPGSVRISRNKTSLERGIGLSVGVEKG